LDETEALLRIEPFDAANSHDVLQSHFEAIYRDNGRLSRA
jgi:hypothetical protein